MEILDRLKGIVGVGQPTIELRGVNTPVHRGESLRGTVVLNGGQRDAPIEDVHVRLDEQRLVFTAPERPERQFWSRAAELVIPMAGRVLKPDETIELAFELALPATLEPSSSSIAYVMIADTEVPGLNPKAELDITVVGT
jgi:sporulation-control protein spo0M